MGEKHAWKVKRRFLTLLSWLMAMDILVYVGSITRQHQLLKSQMGAIGSMSLKLGPL